MYILIGYQKAKEQWPEAVEEVVAKLRRGKSVHRDADPAALGWGIGWCLQVRGYSLGEVLSGKVPDPTPDDRLKKNIANSTAWLEAKKGRWSGQSKPLKDLPQEVIDLHVEAAEEDRRERGRVAALTPEERIECLREAVKKLSKYPGLTAIRVTKKGR